MAGTCDNVELLLLGQVDELDRVAGNTDGEVGVLLLFGVLHGVQQLFHAKDVDVQVVGTLVKVCLLYTSGADNVKAAQKAASKFDT